MASASTPTADALSVRDLRKSYALPRGQKHETAADTQASASVILDIPQLRLARAEELALSGPSGSGKTTLLHAIAGILPVDSGVIELAGRDMTRMGEAQRDRWRARHLGYVFQNFQLLEGFSALENVCLPMMFAGSVDESRARSLLDRVGLQSRLHHRPRQLSVGQRQRVALARALASKPALVIADEPTGSLDREQARAALALLRDTCRENGCALLLVSHDQDILGAFDRRLDLDALQRQSKQRS